MAAPAPASASRSRYCGHGHRRSKPNRPGGWGFRPKRSLRLLSRAQVGAVQFAASVQHQLGGLIQSRGPADQETKALGEAPISQGMGDRPLLSFHVAKSRQLIKVGAQQGVIEAALKQVPAGHLDQLAAAQRLQGCDVDVLPSHLRPARTIGTGPGEGAQGLLGATGSQQALGDLGGEAGKSLLFG